MPTIAPTAPASVSARPSPTLVHRQVPLTAAAQLLAYLQTDARDGDEVTLPPGMNLGNFTLPATPRPGWVKLILTGCTATSLAAVSGAQGYALLRGPTVKRPPVSDAETVYDLVNLGVGSRRIHLDELMIQGTPSGQTRRGVSLNGTDLSMSKCQVTEIHETGADSQAVNGIHGAGPFLVEDCLLQGAGENVMFGGGDPSTKDLIPSDITLRRCQLTKPPSMLSGPWTRKNLFELKNAQRVLMEDCELSNLPGGVAIVITPRNQEGRAPWCTVRDVLIRNCRVNQVGALFSGQTTDDEQKSGVCARIALRNIHGLAVSDRLFYWSGMALTLEDLEVDHCTALPTRNDAFFLEGWGRPLFRRLKLTNNLLGFGSYANQAIDALKAAGNLEDSEIRQNGLVNAGDVDGGGADRNQRLDATRYISIPDAAAAGIDLATGTLAPTSPYRAAATDGGPLGYRPSASIPGPVPVPEPEPIPVPTPEPPPPTEDLEARVYRLEMKVAKMQAALKIASNP